MEKVISNKKRKSNIELIRIIAMIFIIIHHYALHGGLLTITSYSANKYIGAICFLNGKIGVNLFILISGYFLVNSKFEIKKLLKITLQVFSYTIPLFMLFVLIKNDITKELIKKTFLPITYGAYWFITIYIGLYILSPFINKFIKSVSQKNLQVLFIILFILFCVIPTITSTTKFMGNLQWFIFMYMLGAYIQLYGINKIKKSTLKWWVIGLYIVYAIVVCGITYISQTDVKQFSRIYQVIEMNYLIPFLISIFMFLLFENLNVSNNKFINLLGKTSFGVYLFHDSYFREAFWKKIFEVESFYNAEPYILILHIIGSVIAIYLIGTLIELIRVKIIEEPIFKIKKFDKWFDKIDKVMEIE